MARKFIFSLDEYYHLYNRGTEKRDIFMDDTDFLRFAVLLHIVNNTESVHVSNLLYPGRSLVELFTEPTIERLVDIGAYCQMPNHFHLLVRERREDGISLFMQKLLTAQTMYFNTKYDRTGTLFQGKFKARHVDSDPYLKYLFSYIHLNPVKLIDPRWKESGRARDLEMVKKFLRDYRHSSFLDYCANISRPQSIILNRGAFPEYFSTNVEHLNELYDWLAISS